MRRCERAPRTRSEDFWDCACGECTLSTRRGYQPTRYSILRLRAYRVPAVRFGEGTGIVCWKPVCSTSCGGGHTGRAGNGGHCRDGAAGTLNARSHRYRCQCLGISPAVAAGHPSPLPPSEGGAYETSAGRFSSLGGARGAPPGCHVHGSRPHQ